MKTYRFLFFALLGTGIIHTHAQDTPVPASVQTEMQKWIATTDAQWQAAFNRDVVDVHAADLKNLKAQYAASLDAAVAKASAAGDLDGAIALRNEQGRFSGTTVFPEQDIDGAAPSVKQIRAVSRLQLARIEKEHVIRIKALHAKYDAMLAQAQQQLTQAKRLDDALMIKAKREEVYAAWVTITAPAAAEKANLPVLPPAANVQKTTMGASMEAPATNPTGVADVVWGSTPDKAKKLMLARPDLVFVSEAPDKLIFSGGTLADQMVERWELFFIRGKFSEVFISFKAVDALRQYEEICKLITTKYRKAGREEREGAAHRATYWEYSLTTGKWGIVCDVRIPNGLSLRYKDKSPSTQPERAKGKDL